MELGKVRTLDVTAETLVRGHYQLRQGLDADTVERYRAAMDEGAEMPPVVVYSTSDGLDYLVDGEHRVEAWIQRLDAGTETRKEIPARWLPVGPASEAWLYAVQSNSSNGLPYTTNERHAAIAALLTQCPELTFREIAKIVGVRKSTVDRVNNLGQSRPKKSRNAPETETAKTEPEQPKDTQDTPDKAEELSRAGQKAELQKEVTCAGCGKTYKLSEVIDLEEADVRWNGCRVAWLACTPECVELAKQKGLEAAADQLIEQAQAPEPEQPTETPAETAKDEINLVRLSMYEAQLRQAKWDVEQLGELCKSENLPYAARLAKKLETMAKKLEEAYGKLANTLEDIEEFQESAQGGAH